MQQYLPFTVLKRYTKASKRSACHVATVPTVYGIETTTDGIVYAEKEKGMLQQYLPFTVLKLVQHVMSTTETNELLQQYLPFTVLKLKRLSVVKNFEECCNSTYRLRY